MTPVTAATSDARISPAVTPEAEVVPEPEPETIIPESLVHYHQQLIALTSLRRHLLLLPVHLRLSDL